MTGLGAIRRMCGLLRAPSVLPVPALILPAVLATSVPAAPAAHAMLPAAVVVPAHVARVDSLHTLRFDGMRRSYRLHVPAGLGSGQAALVVLLHGRYGTGAEMARLTGFDAVADRAGAVVAYPDGWRRSWADGRGTTPADRRGLDDVGFVLAVIGDVGRRMPIDPARVYVAGMSNGGFMAQRLACDAAGRIAAIGVVAATLSQAESTRCRPSRPLAVMLVNGTADPLVPFGGGQVRGGRGPVLSAPATAEWWVRRDGCTAAPVTRALPDTAHDGTRIEELSYGGCRAGASVLAVHVEGGGHAWPGGGQYLSPRLVGKASRNLDASAALWAFFARSASRR